jgi:hypothetical protein
MVRTLSTVDVAAVLGVAGLFAAVLFEICTAPPSPLAKWREKLSASDATKSDKSEPTPK